MQIINVLTKRVLKFFIGEKQLPSKPPKPNVREVLYKEMKEICNEINATDLTLLLLPRQSRKSIVATDRSLDLSIARMQHVREILEERNQTAALMYESGKVNIMVATYLINQSGVQLSVKALQGMTRYLIEIAHIHAISSDREDAISHMASLFIVDNIAMLHSILEVFDDRNKGEAGSSDTHNKGTGKEYSKP